MPSDQQRRSSEIIDRMTEAAASLPMNPSDHSPKAPTVLEIVTEEMFTPQGAWEIIQFLNLMMPTNGFSFAPGDGAPKIAESSILDFLRGHIALAITKLAEVGVWRMPADWLKDLCPGREMGDCDGWDDKPYDEPVNRAEFCRRVRRSTLRDVSQHQTEIGTSG